MNLMSDDQLDSIARRREVERSQYALDDKELKDPFVTSDSYTVFYQTDGYIRLASVVRAKAPGFIRARMIKSLQIEILGRQLVDNWHEEQRKVAPGADDAGAAASHAYFTSVLKRTMGILLPPNKKHAWTFQSALKAADLYVQEVEAEVMGASDDMDTA